MADKGARSRNKYSVRKSNAPLARASSTLVTNSQSLDRKRQAETSSCRIWHSIAEQGQRIEATRSQEDDDGICDFLPAPRILSLVSLARMHALEFCKLHGDLALPLRSRPASFVLLEASVQVECAGTKEQNVRLCHSSRVCECRHRSEKGEASMASGSICRCRR